MSMCFKHGAQYANTELEALRPPADIDIRIDKKDFHNILRVALLIAVLTI